MFWTSTYTAEPRIERADMNGANRTMLVNTRLAYPSGLSIDHYMKGRIYWCDHKLNVIESMNPDGTDRRVVTATGSFENL